MFKHKLVADTDVAQDSELSRTELQDILLDPEITEVPLPRWGEPLVTGWLYIRIHPYTSV